MNMSSYKFDNYRVIFSGLIKNISPLIIGSGDGSEADSDVLKDYKGIPYVSGSSFAGVLRHHFEKHYNDCFNIEKFFGYSNDAESGHGSKIIFSDIKLNSMANINIQIRDGIKINNRGITEDKAKFDYEVIEPSAEFNFKIEISSDNKSDDKNELLKIISVIKRDIEKNRIKIGAKTNLGFGKIQFTKESLSCYDLQNKSDIIKWLKKEDNLFTEAYPEPFKFNYDDFNIEFYFAIKDSLIVRHYSTDPQSPDAEHFKSGGSFIIPGTSLKGAIRARGEKILNTLNIDNKSKLIKYFFGDSQTNNNENKNKNNKKNSGSVPSRLQVSEVIIEQNAETAIQQRIKIDRFTDATINGALFDSMPLFIKDEKKLNILTMIIKEPINAEIGLLLLIIKDLWTEDLPIGGEKNIGRGLLKGKKAIISYKDLNITIPEDISSMSQDDRKKLQSYVDDLLNNQNNENYFKEKDVIYNI